MSRASGEQPSAGRLSNQDSRAIDAALVDILFADLEKNPPDTRPTCPW